MLPSAREVVLGEIHAARPTDFALYQSMQSKGGCGSGFDVRSRVPR